MALASNEPKPSWLPPVAIQDALVLGILFWLLGNQLVSFADSASLGWQLKTGAYVTQHGEVPVHDPFLALSGEHPWIAHDWLADIVLWRAFAAGSWPLVYALTFVVFAAGYLAVLYSGAAKITGQSLLTSLAVIPVLNTGLAQFSVQPAVFSSFLFMLVVLVISSWLAHLRARRSATRRLLIALPLLFAIWANVHPHFVFGLALVILLAIGVWIEGRLERHRTYTAASIWLWGIVMLCIAATLLNPYGWRVFSDLSWAQLTSGWNQRAAVDGGTQCILAILFLGSVCSRSGARQYGHFEILSLLAFGWLGLRYPSLAPLFGIVALIPAVRALESIASRAAKVKGAERVAGIFQKLEIRERHSLAGLPLIAVLSAILLADANFNMRLLTYTGPFGPQARIFPYGAIEVLKETATEEAALVVAAPIQWGGFITLFAEGTARPLLDDRIQVAGTEAYAEFLQALRVGGEWRNFISRHGITHLLLSPSEPLAMSLKTSGEMLLVYEDNVSMLFDARSAQP